MKGFGLIGYPLSHSFSGKYFAEKFEREGISDCTYKIFPLKRIDLLPLLIREHKDLLGLNVTIPYKQQVIPFLDNIDDDTAHIGAVNTIKIYRKDKIFKLKGFNTDVYGFSTSIQPFITGDHKNALVLGTGGGAKAVAFVLERWGIKVTFVSRTPRSSDHISYKMITPQIMAASRIIVNTTPAGMYPGVDSCPDIPYKNLTSEHLLFDLIYNPAETRFMARGKSMGSVVMNGLQMLKLQADKAWEIWNADSL